MADKYLDFKVPSSQLFSINQLCNKIEKCRFGDGNSVGSGSLHDFKWSDVFLQWVCYVRMLSLFH